MIEELIFGVAGAEFTYSNTADCKLKIVTLNGETIFLQPGEVVAMLSKPLPDIYAIGWEGRVVGKALDTPDWLPEGGAEELVAESKLLIFVSTVTHVMVIYGEDKD